MKRPTQLQMVRAKMRSNTMHLNETIDRTELEANSFLFETGCLFLEMIYGAQTELYEKHSRNRHYWSWFRLQWHGVEESYIYIQNRHSKRLPKKMRKSQYVQYMNFFCCTSERMEMAFRNYLKQLR